MDRRTRLCISLAARPSDVGTRFHNFLYAELGLNFVYKAFTTGDLAGAVTGIRALGIRGCGVSMPYKQDVLPMLDGLDPSAEAIGAVNTIVNDDGTLTGYNTDVLAVQALLPVGTGRSALVAGSGGMASAVVAALRRSGFDDIVIAARNEEAGPALAERCGARWVPDPGGHRADVLVNATPIGMAGADPDAAVADPAFPRAAVSAAHTVVDVVASPPRTPLIALAEEFGVRTVTGDAVMALQAAEQFRLYTGTRPDDDQVRRAREYSRRT
ncbi:shikimate 5-dehydrogenase [Tomitella fengzijianii]|uniref:Shikimate 5-dehydrogenase n=1 Tax=Tomitella fengzijianii TaxID=2597660 RepID=A0A516X8T1_9ACTN|nr:shikimate 5-dehydrogenase [Tomitella fengzijianii]QDQ99432.1 shikimate 5-dehydrogenase [Tomitella fengzijianii]